MTVSNHSKSDFLLKLKQNLSHLKADGSHLLIGFSGGADSTALLYGLHQISQETQLKITAAHLNHQVRKSESAADAQWVQSFAEQIQVPIMIENWQHNRQPADGGFEEAAREARYEFLIRNALKLKCDSIAVAHTADDQVETILHHVLRGTGLAGLRGIPETRQLDAGLLLLRPLLTTSRTEIEEYLNGERIEYRMDSTNANTDWTRNRIRNDLLPLLQQQYNPNVKQALLRLGRQANDGQQALQLWSRQILDEVILDQQQSVVRIRNELLKQYPIHIIRECLKEIWTQQHWPRKRMGYEKWSELSELVTNPESSVELHLPAGLTANRRGNILVLSENN